MAKPIAISASDTIGTPPQLKVYLDTNIISAWVKEDILPEEFEALQLVLQAFHTGTVVVWTSHVAGEELDKLPAEHRRTHRLVYEFIKRVPIAPEGVVHSALMPHGVPGSRHYDDPILISLRSLLKEMDARHVFQAIKNQADIFLTVDGGILHRAHELAKHGVSALLPTDLVRELERTRDA